LVLGKL